MNELSTTLKVLRKKPGSELALESAPWCVSLVFLFYLFIFFPPASCCAQNVSVRLLLWGLLSTTRVTQTPRGENKTLRRFFPSAVD